MGYPHYHSPHRRYHFVRGCRSPHPKLLARFLAPCRYWTRQIRSGFALGGEWFGYIGGVTVAGDVDAAAIQRCENVGEVLADDISEAAAVVVLGTEFSGAGGEVLVR